MTKRNSNWISDNKLKEKENEVEEHQVEGTQPFLLEPAGKDYLWGGSRLQDDFGKNIDMEPLAETWECSTHPDGISKVASGEHAGKLLTEVLKEHPEYLGTHPKSGSELPILIKLIDAKENLSVQVHPDDSYAREKENGQLGKTEMWYVLDTVGDARLTYGFHHEVTKEMVRDGVKNGTIEKYLQKISIKKDDVFYIEAGQVHAIGAGSLIAEIQENSNLTYRLYDYNRVDKNGNKRPLHLDKALQVANLKESIRPNQPMRTLCFHNGYATDLLCRCKYFQVERMLLNTERYREMADFQTGDNSFQVLLCTEGCGVCFWGEHKMLNFHKGDCIFIPANSVSFKLHGKAQLLKVSC